MIGEKIVMRKVFLVNQPEGSPDRKFEALT